MNATNLNTIEFIHSDSPIKYEDALSTMEQMHKDVLEQDALGKIWFLEHEDVYTKGNLSDDADVINTGFIPVIETGRGGKITYHGPGQRIIYPILNLKKLHKAPDVRKYVVQLEDAVIEALSKLNINAYKVPERVGIWVNVDGKESKIAAIGIRIKKWVTYHGIAINVNADLSKFDGIVPCGLHGYGVCSLQSLGHNISMDEFDILMQKALSNVL